SPQATMHARHPTMERLSGSSGKWNQTPRTHTKKSMSICPRIFPRSNTSMSNRLENSVRIFVAALGFVGAMFISPWVPIVYIVLLALRFRAWEAVVLGAFVDFLWLPGSALSHMPL